jgi:hypothetical protein
MADIDAWFYRLMGDVMGPVTSRALRDLASKGTIDFDTPIRKGTDGDWVSAASIKGLFAEPEVFPPVAPPPPRPKSANKPETTRATTVSTRVLDSEPSDGMLPSSLERLSFGFVRVVMMLVASVASLALLWFLVLAVLNLPNVGTGPSDPNLYSNLKAKTRIDASEVNKAKEQSGDAEPVDTNIVDIHGFRLRIPKRLKGVFTSFTTEIIEATYLQLDRKFLIPAGDELQEFVDQMDQDKDLKGAELERIGKDMIFAFCREQVDRFKKIESQETARMASLVGAWSGLTMAFVTLVAVILILVLLAIERNTRSA